MAEATQVAEMLGDLPLAVEQASAWLAETGMSAAEYVERLENQLAAAMDLSQPDDYPTTVAATFRLSFDRLRERSPGAARLLELCAYFSPDPISLSLLYSDQMIESLLPHEARLKERSVLAVLIRDLTRFSLVKVDRGSNTIEVDTLRTAKSLAVSLRKMGRVTEAFELTRQTSERYVSAYGADQPDALACQLNLACDQSALDDHAAAYETASEVLRAYEESIGTAHPFTLAARNNISTYLRGTGSVRTALELADRTLAGLRVALGDDHQFTLTCAVNRANCLHDLGRLGDAESSCERRWSGCPKCWARATRTPCSARRTSPSRSARAAGPTMPSGCSSW